MFTVYGKDCKYWFELRELGDEVVFTAHSQGLVVYHTSFGTKHMQGAGGFGHIFPFSTYNFHLLAFFLDHPDGNQGVQNTIAGYC